MKIVLVAKYLWPDRTGEIHHPLFHGLAEREGVAPAESECSALDRRHKQPFLISKNVFNLSDIFSPSATLIVSGRVRAILENLPNVLFEPVRFRHLCYLPFEVGVFSYPKYRYPGVSPEKLLLSAPAISNPETIPPYFELITAIYTSIFQKYPQRKIYSFPHPTPEDDCIEELELCSAMLLDYPMLFTQFGLLFSKELFLKLDPYFCWDYFVKIDLEIE
jgi:hypothetical protein